MLRIQIIYGRLFVRNEDKERAISAAEQSLAKAGVTAEQAHAAFHKWWLNTENQDYAAAPEPATAWIFAEDAANAALTDGWHDPNGASCAIAMVLP